MTPCEKLGYEAGDRFEVVIQSTFDVGDTVELLEDDESDMPLFRGVGRPAWNGSDQGYITLHKLKPITCEKITLQPGDYVLTEGMNEATYHKVAQKFMEAGAEKGEYPEMEWLRDFDYFGWEPIGFLNHTSCLVDEYSEREIPIDQVLGEDGADALPEVGSRWLNEDTEEVEIVAINGKQAWVRNVKRANCSFIITFDSLKPLKTEREKAVEEMVKALGVDSDEWVLADVCAEMLYNAGYRKTGE